MPRNIKRHDRKQGAMNNESVGNNDGEIHSAQQVGPANQNARKGRIHSAQQGRPANKIARKLDRLAVGLEIIQLLEAEDHPSQGGQPYDTASTAQRPSPAQRLPALPHQHGKQQLTTNQWMHVIDTMVTGIEESVTEDEMIRRIKEMVALTSADQGDKAHSN